jgi:uncharacterized membrane protein YkoI
MRRVLLGLILAVSATSAARADNAEQPCLSAGDAVEIITAHEVVPPSEALLHVRRAVPDSEILRASLCRETDKLVYRILVLTKEGRVVRVTVDAPSGKVTIVH